MSTMCSAGRINMVSLILSFTVLLLGYFFYGRVVEKVFSPDDRQTPAYRREDGVDFIPMPTWKAFLVQLLNIAGTGPIFGALMGACFGPVVFLWIILGAILGGGVHDYMSGMISARHDGASIAELSGIYLGTGAKWLMRLFSIVLLILTGTVFVNSPAALLERLTPDAFSITFWIIVILIYYVLATLLPIDKIIGRLYPVFGAVLIIMAAGILAGVIAGGYTIPEITLKDLHPEGLPVWPYMFVTVACGAISGFHATQSPMVAKCLKSEKMGRRVFYGAMLSESVIALVWAAGGVAFYGATGGLKNALTELGQSGVVYDISTGMLGRVGGILAIVGVIACPITSGDTAFRSARLILAEITGLDQKQIRNRLVITLPLLGIGALLTQLDFNVLWRYFSWSNQTLAMIALWVAAAYLLKNASNKYYSVITALPASFMTAVSVTYILMAQEGFRLPAKIGYPVGIAVAAIVLVIFFILGFRRKRKDTDTAQNITKKQYEDLFLEMKPGFFDRDYVRAVPVNEPASEMILCLRDFDGKSYVKSLGDEISFGYFHGDMDRLKEDVARVVPAWVNFFGEDSRVYCGFIDGRVASFCLIEDFGEHIVGGRKWKIGGPGCVGTLPEFRNRGIGLSMIREVTKILKEEQYDYSFIHHTYVTGWYGKLGYRTILRWHGKGFEQ